MSDSDPDALQERVDELETAVAQQQETIRDMLPSRRGVLAGMAGVAAGAAGMNAATEEAAAQSAVGQVGTESNPVDVEGATGKFDSVNTGTSLTDPAGVTHTGELADLSDTGGGGNATDAFPINETGTVASGDAGLLMATTVPDGSSFDVTQLGIGLLGVGGLPSGMNVTIITLDASFAGTEQTIVYSGDGTDSNDLTGSPLASYANTSGGSQTVGIVVDNGQFSAAGTANTEEVSVVADAEVV